MPAGNPFETTAASYGPQVLWPDHCVQGTFGAALHEGLRIPHAELVLRKGYHRAIDSYSAFYENDRATPTGLSAYLRERGLVRVCLAGLAHDFCVRYSAEDAQREGFSRHHRGRRLPRHRSRWVAGGGTPEFCFARHRRS